MSLQGATLRGDLKAEVVLIEFSDFECPYCAKLVNEVQPDIERLYVRPGRVKVAFRHLPLPIHGTDTASAVPEKVRNLVLDRSQATVYLVACGDRDHRIHAKETRAKIPWNFPLGGYDWILKDAAERTGGSFYTSESEGDFGQSLADALTELRSRYLIAFQPQGVSDSGWHLLQVQLPSHSGVEIRARKAYYAR